jgi:import inner membrane translocase subunit TIM23
MHLVGTGAIIGPTIGTALWRLQYRRLLPLIDAKDHQFFQRIAKNRVDATLQSPTNPVPDYYGKFYIMTCYIIQAKPLTGEKIGSLHDYRTVGRFPVFYVTRSLMLNM